MTNQEIAKLPAKAPVWWYRNRGGGAGHAKLPMLFEQPSFKGSRVRLSFTEGPRKGEQTWVSAESIEVRPC